MKHLLLSLVLAISVFIAGCSSLSPNQNAILASVGSSALSLLQNVTDIAIKTVLAKALSGDDLVAKSNFIDSAASALRTLEGNTGGVISPELIVSTVTQFTDPTKTHWNVLAQKVADQVISSDLSTDLALEVAATGLNAAAATTR